MTGLVELKQSITVTEKQLKEAQFFVRNQSKHALAQTSVNTMRHGLLTFWRQHYCLRKGQTNQVALLASQRDFRGGRKNKRLVGFSYEKGQVSPGMIRHFLHISSRTMNMYENTAHLKGWATGIDRPGTHIMQRLGGDAQALLELQAVLTERAINDYCAKV